MPEATSTIDSVDPGGAPDVSEPRLLPIRPACTQ